MNNEEWQEFVEHLVEAKREMARAWAMLDGLDGATEETQIALSHATDSVDLGHVP